MKTAVSIIPRTWAGIFRACCTVFLLLLAASAQARQHQIQVGETGFTPKHMVIFIGDTVQWVNNTAFNAVIVSGTGSTPDADPLIKNRTVYAYGGKTSQSFPLETGVHHYFNTSTRGDLFSRGMTGPITVQERPYPSSADAGEGGALNKRIKIKSELVRSASFQQP